jgi:phosphoribosylformylglycinamidine synthase II
MRCMAVRITVRSTVPDGLAHSYLRTLTHVFPRAKLRDVVVTRAYTISAQLSNKKLRRAAELLANPLIEQHSISRVLAPKRFSYAIEIGFHPGVTDNVGATAKQTIEDGIGRFREDEGVYSSVFLFLEGSLSRNDAERMARELHNPLIERVSVFSFTEAKRGIPLVVPEVHLSKQARTDKVDLDVDDEDLARIGKRGIANPDGTRRGPLALSLRAMKVIQAHFKKLGRNPTDVELESLAQTWSEHCKHSIFADPLDEVKEGIYKRYIKGATEKIRKAKGKKDFCVSVFKDNSGAIRFDDEYLVTHKVETHNSPSALDPFGGAITGIVGVNRDALGFGMGAKPIANVYGFCVGKPDEKRMLYKDEGKQQPMLSPRRILEGVIRGINAGGNQSGIPTPLGFVATDDSYRGKPLVFAGTVGLIPRSARGKKLYEKKARAGDYIVMIGGRVGLDGIHGATFSSEALASGSPATAVQIGDAITQKKLSDALIREARDAGLYSSITDNGAGGLSCSVAEMARECGGAIVDLEKVPLKYPGLAPWQIWISESQERMTLAVPKKNWTRLKKIFDRHGVEATRIGIFTDSDRCVVRYRGARVMDMDMSFLHDGRPVEHQKGKEMRRAHAEPKIKRTDLAKTIVEILARPNVASTAFIAEQYDHEVQGTSVTKPLQGRGRVNAESGVIRPVYGSDKGVVLAHGYAPWYSAIDTYAMALAAIDTAVRNAICAGASRDYLAILDNFCWSSSNTSERLWELKRAAKACFDAATAYGTPFVSGKDSMFNDFRGYTDKGEQVHIAALPTLLVSAIGVMPDAARAVTLDAKMSGDALYLIGETHDELGGSEYASLLSEREGKDLTGNQVPRVDLKKNARAYDALSRAIRDGLVASALGVGRGGLAVALAKTLIAGGLGASVDLRKLPGTARRDESFLFSESQGRMLITVRPSAERAFRAYLKGISFARIGEVTERTVLMLRMKHGSPCVSVASLAASYRKTFKNW